MLVRILLIEADRDLAGRIHAMLQSEGARVSLIDLGEAAVDLGRLYQYDIILLAPELPDMSGLNVWRRLRAAKVVTPILFIARPDGYVIAPPAKDELVAQIDAIVRRARAAARAVIRTGDLVVNCETRIAEVSGARLYLTGKEYQVIELLSLRKGRTITRERLLEHLYGGGEAPASGFIDALVAKLGRKLALATGGIDYIRADNHGGYELVDPA